MRRGRGQTHNHEVLLFEGILSAPILARCFPGCVRCDAQLGPPGGNASRQARPGQKPQGKLEALESTVLQGLLSMSARAFGSDRLRRSVLNLEPRRLRTVGQAGGRRWVRRGGSNTEQTDGR